MVHVIPFRGFLPLPDKVQEVSCLPPGDNTGKLDNVSPHSLLHAIISEKEQSKEDFL